MQDIFIEYLVKKKSTPQTTLLKLLIVLGAILALPAILFLSQYLGMFSILSPILAVGALYGAYYLITSMNVEYEYSVTNGELDIDKIIAQRKRKRLLTINCRSVESFGRYKASEHTQKSYQTRMMTCDAPDSPDLWYCTVRAGDKGLTLVVFNASEKMLGAIKPFLPRPIMHEAFRAGGQ